MIRTLIVDDQSMIRVGIRAILESQDDMTVVGEAENGRLGVRAVPQPAPGRGADGRPDAGAGRPGRDAGDCSGRNASRGTRRGC